jgi:hypothetical protein
MNSGCLGVRVQLLPMHQVRVTPLVFSFTSARPPAPSIALRLLIIRRFLYTPPNLVG